MPARDSTNFYHFSILNNLKWSTRRLSKKKKKEKILLLLTKMIIAAMGIPIVRNKTGKLNKFNLLEEISRVLAVFSKINLSIETVRKTSKNQYLLKTSKKYNYQ